MLFDLPIVASPAGSPLTHTLSCGAGDGRHLRQPAHLHREGMGLRRRGTAAGARVLA